MIGLPKYVADPAFIGQAGPALGLLIRLLNQVTATTPPGAWGLVCDGQEKTWADLAGFPAGARTLVRWAKTLSDLGAIRVQKGRVGVVVMVALSSSAKNGRSGSNLPRISDFKVNSVRPKMTDLVENDHQNKTREKQQDDGQIEPVTPNLAELDQGNSLDAPNLAELQAGTDLALLRGNNSKKEPPLTPPDGQAGLFGVGGKKSPTKKKNKPQPEPKRFVEFWTAYPARNKTPRKPGKSEARIRYAARLAEGWTEEELIRAAQAYAKTDTAVEGVFVMHPSTFLGPKGEGARPFTDFLEPDDDEPINVNPYATGVLDALKKEMESADAS